MFRKRLTVLFLEFNC